MIPSIAPNYILRRAKQFPILHLKTSSKLNARYFYFSQTLNHSSSKLQFHSICKFSTKKQQSFHEDYNKLPSSNTSHNQSAEIPKAQYELTFTCKPCGARSTHCISKQGYHFGSVLVACPSCKNRHVISDNLKIFGDKKVTVEDMMNEQGHFVKKGILSENGAYEIWADGSSNKRTEK